MQTSNTQNIPKRITAKKQTAENRNEKEEGDTVSLFVYNSNLKRSLDVAGSVYGLLSVYGCGVGVRCDIEMR